MIYPNDSETLQAAYRMEMVLTKPGVTEELLLKMGVDTVALKSEFQPEPQKRVAMRPE